MYFLFILDLFFYLKIKTYLSILTVPNLSGSKHYDPGLAPIENSSGSDPYFFPTTYSFFGWADSADFGADQLENVLRSALPIGTKVIPGLPDPLWPAKLKMVIFGCFWNFGQLKSMQMGKSKMYILKRNRPAFQRYQTGFR